MIKMNELGKHGKAPAIWYEVAGYVMTVTELGEVFGIHHVTLRNRLRSGWNIVPACMVGNTSNMTLHQVSSQSNPSQDDDDAFTKVLFKHFGRPSLLTMLKDH